MTDISFSPGPSQVHAEIRQYLTDAFDQGILSISHRSTTFNDLSAQTLSLLRKKLAIPDDYLILYTSSATECWEIIAQSLTKKQSLHVSSGSFGDKWHHYAQQIHPESKKIPLSLTSPLRPDMISAQDADVICLTQNETSNGTQLDFNTLASIRGAFPNKLIALDCTSSLGGLHLPFALGDVWFGSVQKCFGLPAGLGILIVSPAAVKQAQEIGDKTRYNSLLTLLEHIEKYQTSHTPNVLGIYLLNRVMQQSPSIEQTDAELRKRMKAYEAMLPRAGFDFLIKNEQVRSITVLAVESSPERISWAKEQAKSQGLILGSGYGKWKAGTFRIANFPAHSSKDVEKMLNFLSLLS